MRFEKWESPIQQLQNIRHTHLRPDLSLHNVRFEILLAWGCFPSSSGISQGELASSTYSSPNYWLLTLPSHGSILTQCRRGQSGDSATAMEDAGNVTNSKSQPQDDNVTVATQAKLAPIFYRKFFGVHGLGEVANAVSKVVDSPNPVSEIGCVPLRQACEMCALIVLSC
jgi:hypothetical protein